MKVFQLFISSFVLVSVFLVPAAVFAAPELPHVFYGNVQQNGEPLPAGSVITAQLDDGTEVGSITLEESGVYGESGAYGEKLLVQGESIGEGATIHFFTSENEANETVSFESGAVEALALTFTVDETDNGNDPGNSGGSGGGSGGSSGGGGGGGGSVTTSNETNDVSNVAGDTNNDGVTDLLDFNLLMVNWGANPDNPSADLTGDGIVDILDFNTLIVNWTA